MSKQQEEMEKYALDKAQKIGFPVVLVLIKNKTRVEEVYVETYAWLTRLLEHQLQAKEHLLELEILNPRLKKSA